MQTIKIMFEKIYITHKKTHLHPSSMSSDKNIQKIEVYFMAIYLWDFTKWCPKSQEEKYHFIST